MSNGKTRLADLNYIFKRAMNFEIRFKQLLDVPDEKAANALPYYDVISRRRAMNIA
jgi:hypothetical protein